MRSLLILSLCLAQMSCISFNFSDFQRRYHKNYSSPSEQEYRMSVIQNNLKIVEGVSIAVGDTKILLGASLFGTGTSYNKDERLDRLRNCYKRTPNMFLDLTPEEFERYYLLPERVLYRSTPAQSLYARTFLTLGSSNRRLQTSPNIPRSVNYLEQGFITPVKDQKRCNACYAFAATSAVEALFKRRNRTSVSLSEQEILDCSKEDEDCVGGQPSTSLQYIVSNGISYESAYPYTAVKGTCKSRKRLLMNGQITVFSPGNPVPFTSPYSQDGSQLYLPPGPGPQSPLGPIFLPPRGGSVKPPGRSKSPKRSKKGKRSKSPKKVASPVKPNHNPPQNQNNHNNGNGNVGKNNNKNSQNPNPGNANPNPQPSPSTGSRFTSLKGFQFIENNINALLRELAKGPVVVAMYVSNEFKFYSEGVFNGEGCSGATKANHAALAVGYNLDTEIPYIVLKNSWGGNWGDKGFYKMAIGKISNSDHGICLMASTHFNVYPVM